MVAHVNSTVPNPSPTLSDKPVRVTLLTHLAMLVLLTPVVMLAFPEVALAHQLYIAFLASGLIAFGGLMLAMLGQPMVKALKTVNTSRASQSEGNANAALATA